MAEYYDKNKFTGERKSSPPQKKKDDNWWYSWPVIIGLFALNLAPIALVLLFINLSGDEKKNKDSAKKARDAFVNDAVERAMARADAKRKQDGQSSTVQPTAQSPAAGTDGKKKQSKKKSGKKSAKKAEQEVPGKVLKIVGICLLAVGVLTGIEPVANLIEGLSYYLEDLLISLSFAAAGGIMWGRGNYLARTFRRSRRYIQAIGRAESMALAEIAKRVNCTPEKAARELQKLIDKGYLGEDAYIDHEKGYFLRFGAVIEEPKRQAAPVQKEAEEGYSGILRKIRRANDRIADEELSRKIDRLEQISALIFKEVEEHPEKRERIRKFFDYYLPTTQKLLDAYAEFEETGVEGTHLRQAKERIEQTMDSIVEGFEHQLDQLYSADALDVVSDIRVMETMIRRETASAEKDFGYDQREKDSGGEQRLSL